VRAFDHDDNLDERANKMNDAKAIKNIMKVSRTNTAVSKSEHCGLKRLDLVWAQRAITAINAPRELRYPNRAHPFGSIGIIAEKKMLPVCACRRRVVGDYLAISIGLLRE
jgi:hypothetical protein